MQRGEAEEPHHRKLGVAILGSALMLGFAAGTLGLGPELHGRRDSCRPVHGPRRPGGGGPLLGSPFALLAGPGPTSFSCSRSPPACCSRPVPPPARLLHSDPRAGLLVRTAACANGRARALLARRGRRTQPPYAPSPRESPRCGRCTSRTPRPPRNRSPPRRTRSKPRSRTRWHGSSATSRTPRTVRPGRAGGAEQPTEELELTPMGSPRSAVTESDELDYRLPAPSLLKRSNGNQSPDTSTRIRSRAARRDPRALRHRGAGRRTGDRPARHPPRAPACARHEDVRRSLS